MKTMVLSALFVLMVVATAHGQSVGAPTFSVGNIWKFSDGREVKVTKVDDSGIALSGLRSDCPACLVHYDKNLTPIRITDLESKPIDYVTLSAVFVGPDWKFYDWPLEVKKTWRVSATGFTRGQTQNVTIDSTVAVYEDVKTKAGVFRAYKIQRSWAMSWPGHTGSSWTDTVWYAPEVKTAVKFTSTRPRAIDWELSSHSLK